MKMYRIIENEKYLTIQISTGLTSWFNLNFLKYFSETTGKTELCNPDLDNCELYKLRDFIPLLKELTSICYSSPEMVIALLERKGYKKSFIFESEMIPESYKGLIRFFIAYKVEEEEKIWTSIYCKNYKQAELVLKNFRKLHISRNYFLTGDKQVS